MSNQNTPTGTGGIGEILVSSRSLAEYRAMFALTDADLRRTILDCPGGAAGFTAEIRRRGGQATACDIAYHDDGLARVAATAVAEADRGNRYVRAREGSFAWSFFADPDDHRRARHRSAADFAAHTGVEPHRYVAAALPALPFADRGFDLVLSSHLLFSYTEELDYAFHRAAITDLVRVAATEVRLFPLVPVGSATTYPRLDELRSDLAATGIDSRIVAVDYEFQRGANQMLVCRRANGPVADRVR